MGNMTDEELNWNSVSQRRAAPALVRRILITLDDVTRIYVPEEELKAAVKEVDQLKAVNAELQRQHKHLCDVTSEIGCREGTDGVTYHGTECRKNK